MCVICAAAKKRHMKKEEVLEAIKNNSAGFFGFTLKNGERKTVRTLDDKEFVKFFDETVGDDDVWVMHARIPSRGEKSIDNVHGWSEDGIIFCHNMTITSIDGMMTNVNWKNTDSEFFFRRIFMPFYRGCGEKAYEDGKFCEDLDNLVRHFCGTSNKFLFIMPDNRIVTYGNWVSEPDRKENGKCAFYASNASYKVYKQAWKPAAAIGYRYPYEGNSLLEDYEDDYPPTPPGARTTTMKQAGTDPEDRLKMVRDSVDDVQMCRLALCNLVARGLSSYREYNPGPDEWDEPIELADAVADAMASLTPSAFTDDTYDAVVTGLERLAEGAGADGKAYGPEDFAEEFAEEFAPALIKAGARTSSGIVPYWVKPEHIGEAVTKLGLEWAVFCRVANISVNFGALRPEGLVCTMDMPEVKGASGWKTARAKPEDILVDETLSAETTFKGVGILLDYIQDNDTGNYCMRAI